MKVGFKLLMIVVASWALLVPLSDSILFASVGHWSAFFGLLVAGSCIVAALPAFITVTRVVWITSLGLLTLAAVSGFVHHFDAGDCDVLPFEWLNRYWIQAIPLLVLSIALRIYRVKMTAEPLAGANRRPATGQR